MVPALALAPGRAAPSRVAVLSAAVLSAVVLAGCAGCPPETRVVQERGAKPRLHDALALAQRVLAETEPGFATDTPLRLVHDGVYAINATNLAWNWEQAWMLCVAYDRGGAVQRRGVAMRVDEHGQPFPVSSVNWRDYTGAAC